MKVVEHIERAKGPLFSYEIVPPPRGRTVQDVIEAVEALAPFNPPWIDVTSHAAGAYYQENPDGSVERRIYKKRPGTIGICGIIQNRFKIDTVAHILCLGFTKEETEDALIELNYLGVENILAIRGDGPNYKKVISNGRSVNVYAADLVSQVVDIKKGRYVSDITGAHPIDFCVGVAGYPEKHFEAPNLKLDLHYLKEKVDRGAEYIVTQMFFDNQKYFDFEKACREHGIKVPIIPGLKVLRSEKQLTTLPKNFYIDLPTALVDEISSSPEHASEIGVRWAKKQCVELLERGCRNLHFYVMNDASLVKDVIKSLS
ncbi:MAG: methylenetetrahydrofolate reductase [NAD(P)H] [Bradymonadales bacterium]|nr:MAG: methylenetetrahydrofolate reductase [NAD(P)H] [Bradymonadales bacterium]